MSIHSESVKIRRSRMAFTLDQHLAALHCASTNGTLDVLDARSQSHRIHLRLGMVQAVELADDALRFGEVLAETQPLPPSLLNYAEGVTRARNRRLGELLVHAGLLSPRQRDAVLDRQRVLRLRNIAAAGVTHTTLREALPLPAGASELAPLCMPAWTVSRGRAYAVLELGIGASSEEVVKAYRRLARRLHPDRTGPCGSEGFRAVVDAYRLLSSPSPAS